jgi:mRNA interferase RelE/StbE
MRYRQQSRENQSSLVEGLRLRYKSIFAKSFIKEFSKLPRNARERVLEILVKAAENPYVGTRLRGKLEGLWRCRVGKYRVIYLIDEKEFAVVFLDVGLRKSIYE